MVVSCGSSQTFVYQGVSWGSVQMRIREFWGQAWDSAFIASPQVTLTQTSLGAARAWWSQPAPQSWVHPGQPWHPALVPSEPLSSLLSTGVHVTACSCRGDKMRETMFKTCNNTSSQKTQTVKRYCSLSCFLGNGTFTWSGGGIRVGDRGHDITTLVHSVCWLLRSTLWKYCSQGCWRDIRSFRNFEAFEIYAKMFKQTLFTFWE